MLTLLLLCDLADAKPKKNKTPPPPPVGWHKEEGWKGECYYPPDFGKLGEGERKMARQQALEAMMQQWKGEKDDGVTVEPAVVEEVEIVLLGRPTHIEAISAANRDQCVGVMKGTGSLQAWQGWLGGLPAKLTAGECLQPLSYTLFDYLDLGKGWQRPVPLCKGDKAHIFATVKDKYRISDDGPWINVEGDPSIKAVSADYPCNIEGCFAGMLVGKFTTDAGVETIFPIGADKVFEAPEHGTISWSINDTTWYDNKYFKSATIEDRTAVTIEPAK